MLLTFARSLIMVGRHRRLRSSSWPAWIAAALIALFAALPARAANCEALNGARFKHGRVTSAVALSGTLPPSDLARQAGASMSSALDPTLSNLPAFCRVFATLAPVPGSNITVELWLPADWNRKLLALGNHGFAGEFEHAYMAMGLRRGYAVVTTDTGHGGDPSAQGRFSVGSAKFAVGNPVAVDDYAWRAVHEMTVAAKHLVQRHYSEPARRSYFDGCSTGGRQAMREAQQFPQDYDGIISGGAAMYVSRIFASQLAQYQRAALYGGGRITRDKLLLAQRAQTSACDGLDGVKDGVLQDPRLCRWNPRTILCALGQNMPTCLTAAEAAAIARIESPLTDPKTAKALYPGFEPGSQDLWMSPLGSAGSPLGMITVAYFRDILTGDPAWSPDAADVHQLLALDEQPGTFASKSNSIDPDLSKFRAAGGKLIQYHGWNDPAMPPAFHPDYYEQVVARQPGQDQLEQTRSFYRLFMVPGAGHCTGGSGPVNIGGLAQPASPTIDADHDVLTALERWVEQGVAPDKLIATQFGKDRAIDRQMPICAYPKVARYVGGDVRRPESFACAAPRMRTDRTGHSPAG